MLVHVDPLVNGREINANFHKNSKMLWGRAANRCAICRQELVMDSTETDDESVIGEACHIVAQSSDGPRGDSPLSPDQRDKYGNLILLCNVHHKQIDDQPNTFTVAELQRLKNDHETWVRQSLVTYDSTKQRDDEIYADYVTEWANGGRTFAWLNTCPPRRIRIRTTGQPTGQKGFDPIIAWG
jgi:HNH endonuclease